MSHSCELLDDLPIYSSVDDILLDLFGCDIPVRPCCKCGINVILDPEAIGSSLAGCGSPELGYVHFNCVTEAQC